MARPIRIAITSGDQDGIGPEVTVKALIKIGPKKGVQFFLWRGIGFSKKDLFRLGRKFRLKTVTSWSEALKVASENPKELIDINSALSPAHWVEEAGGACFFGHIDALATAPLSKVTIQNAGMRDIGHTDILKRVSKTQDAYMTFIGKYFKVFLATGHVPLSKITEAVTPSQIERALRHADGFSRFVSSKKDRLKPIGVLGLNPHAGDAGLIGKEEQEWLEPLLKNLNIASKNRYQGPLVPDASFSRQNWGKYSTFFALYHDQGLIPFKALHGQEGVHITWGLPFIRTSVDHGTAKDIAGKDKADSASMQLALKWALKLAETKRGQEP